MPQSTTIPDSSEPMRSAGSVKGLPPPRRFGRFELRSLLGKSKTGDVYLVFDPNIGQFAALRIPRPRYRDGSDWKQRFLANSRAAAKIQHPRICPILEVGEVEGQPYLTMAHLEGPTLAQQIERSTMSLESALHLTHQIALAVSEIHEQGLIHGDLRPSSIKLDRGDQPILLDLGHAIRRKQVNPARNVFAHLALGISEYLAPEQAGSEQRPIGLAFDVYSLGVILYQLTTGRLPFQAPSVGKLLAKIERDPPPVPSRLNPQIDEVLDAFLLKSLQKLPRDRFASATDFANELETIIRLPRPVSHGIAKEASSDVDPSLPTKPHSSGTLLASAISGGLGFVLGALFLFLVLPRPAIEPPATSVGDRLRSPSGVREPASNPIQVEAPRTSEPIAEVRKAVMAPVEPLFIELPGWGIYTGASFDQMQGWLTEQKAASRSVIWIDAVTIDDQPRFCSIVALDDRATDWTALLDASFDEINDIQRLGARVDTNVKLVQALCGYRAGSELKCCVLFHRGAKPGCYLGISPRMGFDNLAAQLYSRGYAAKVLRPVESDGRIPQVAVCFEPSSVKPPEFGLDIDLSRLKQMLNEIRSAGFQPNCIAPFEVRGDLRFALTVDDAPTHLPFEQHSDWTASDLQTKAPQLIATGYRPKSIVGYRSKQSLRYSTIWTKDPTAD